jgi:hypothetical protein
MLVTKEMGWVGERNIAIEKGRVKGREWEGKRSLESGDVVTKEGDECGGDKKMRERRRGRQCEGRTVK